MHAVTNHANPISDLDALLILKTPAAGLNPAHVAALPHAQPLPSAQSEVALNPAKAAAQPRMKWIVTTLRALAAQQA